MVVTQRSLSSPNNGCEEDYDFIGLTRTQLTQSLIFSSRRRQKMGSGSQGAIVHTVQPRKMLCQFLNTTQHSLPVDPPFGCVFCVFNNCFWCLTHSQFLASASATASSLWHSPLPMRDRQHHRSLRLLLFSKSKVFHLPLIPINK